MARKTPRKKKQTTKTRKKKKFKVDKTSEKKQAEKQAGKQEEQAKKEPGRPAESKKTEEAGKTGKTRPVKKEEKTVKKSKAKVNKDKIKAMFARERILTESSEEARLLYDKSAYGMVLEDGRVQLSLPEALYLLEKGKIKIISGRKALSPEDFIKKARKVEPNFWIRYCVFKDMRSRGYIVKTALKFGADFRVYDRGIRPGQDHARWIIFPVHEGETLTWYEFAAKNRVAHSTKKRLMMGIVDEEGDVTYYEIKWMRP